MLGRVVELLELPHAVVRPKGRRAAAAVPPAAREGVQGPGGAAAERRRVARGALDLEDARLRVLGVGDAPPLELLEHPHAVVPPTWEGRRAGERRVAPRRREALLVFFEALDVRQRGRDPRGVPRGLLGATVGAELRERRLRRGLRLGAVRAVDTIIAGTTDKPAVRRRAVLALAPFLGADDIGRSVEEAINRALKDRDWQVRQAAEDLRRITGS